MTLPAEVAAGEAALAAGRLDEARALFQRAIARSPYAAPPYQSLARVFAAKGEWARVAGCWSQVVRLHPNHAPARAALARAQQRAGAHAAAAATWRGLLHRAPDSVEGHVQLAISLVRAGDAVAARAVLADLPAAAEAQPAALVAQAYVDQVFGDAAAARARLERAIGSDPSQPGAYEALAELREFDADDPFIARARALLEGEGIDADGRISLQYALGRMQTSAGDCPAAWSNYAAANALQAGRHASDVADPGRLDRFAAAMEAAFGSEAARAPATAPRRPEPIFIVGMPRSGTTLIEAILAQSPDVTAGGELGKMTEIAREVLGADDVIAGDPRRLAALDVNSCARLADRYRLALVWAGAEVRYVTDKLPANFMWVGLIRRLFPHAPIVHVRRDPRDVAWSCFTHHFDDGYPYMAGLDRIVAYQTFYARLMRLWRRGAGTRLVEIDYAALVADPATHAQTLVAACGLPWDPGHLEFHRSRAPVRTFSRLQVRQPIHARAHGRWRAFAAQLDPWFSQLGQADDVRHGR